MHTHKQLVEIAYKWVLKNGSCGVAAKELVSINNEIPDVIGFGSWGHSVVVECKASRSDFLCDKKKPFRVDATKGMGRFRYYCCPTGLIREDELPETWGLIYVNERGRATLVSHCRDRVPYLSEGETLETPWHERGCNRQAEMNVMYSMLRRLEVRGLIGVIYSTPTESNEPTDTAQ